MDTREWFDEATFSDLTVRLSDGTEIKVQKIIVCRANEYFRKLCGPGSHFAESNHKTIELKDDDPTALRNVLRSIYKLPIEPVLFGQMNWRFWLDLHQTADKYLEPELNLTAKESFRQAAIESTNSDTVFDIIEAIKCEMTHDEETVELGEKLRKDNIGILLKNDRFRAQVDSGGKEAVWQQLDDLIFAADLVKKRYFLCASHVPHMFHKPSNGADGKTQGPCAICQAQNRGNSYGGSFSGGFSGAYGGSSVQQKERTAWLSKQ